MSSAFTFDRVVNLFHCQRSAGYVVEVEKSPEGSNWSATGKDLIAVSHTKESWRTHFDDTSSDFGTRLTGTIFPLLMLIYSSS